MENLATLVWCRHSNDVITDFLKVRFVIISFKKHNLGKSPNFRLLKSMVKRRWEREPQRLAIFKKLPLN